jgi:hypothetical protein
MEKTHAISRTTNVNSAIVILKNGSTGIKAGLFILALRQARRYPNPAS